jgi:RNA polymerase sigma-70 factor (ECF subfamily)
MTDPAESLHIRLLVLRAQTGDAAAFAELTQCFAPRLRYYLRKMLGNNSGVDDALQDIWLDVFRSVHRLADAGAFTGWLYRIARRRAAREFRRPHPVSRPLSEADLIGEPEDDWSPEDAAQIHAALDALAPEQREVLVLRFLEGMSYDDIGRVVGCPVGTVRSRLHYGKCALRRVLEPRCTNE